MNELHAAAFKTAKQMPPERVNEWLTRISKALAEGKASDALQETRAEVALAFCGNCQTGNRQEK